ncbi:TetR/AcrR family transcriptional regulator [Mycobacterium syngnathidarum]
MSTAPPPKAKRSRRSGTEIRSRLLEAAQELFAMRGYAGTSTKEISQRAEVAEILLFRHFGNKAGLYEEAVLSPFEKFAEEYAATWAGHRIGEKPLESALRDYVAMLYEFFASHRSLLLALQRGWQDNPMTADYLNQSFARMQQVALEAAAEFGLPDRNFSLTTQLIVGLIMSTAVHGDFLLPPAEHDSSSTAIDGLCEYVLRGVGVPAPMTDG